MSEFYKNFCKMQAELKAPKGQFNSFGKYNYRSCEDILEAVKPLAQKYGVVINLSDSIEVHGERYYIKATATARNAEDMSEEIVSTAYAREAFEKKGMDDSQVTGTASSYARKYALNGLLLIDDTKDADTDENRTERENKTNQKVQTKEAPKGQPKAELSPIQREINDLSKQAGAILGCAAGVAYRAALKELGIAGKTAAEHKQIVEYLKGVIANGEVPQ